LNSAIRIELQRFRRTNFSNKQYRQAGHSFETFAIRIGGLLQFREEILDASQEKGLDTIELIFSTICNDCVAPSHNQEDNPDRSYQVPQPDPAHLLELDDVLELAHTGERVLSRPMTAQPNFSRFVKGLKRLTSALQKERQHYRNTQPNPPVPKIKFVEDLGTCPICHKPNAPLQYSDETT
jgi:hypothetical protein